MKHEWPQKKRNKQGTVSVEQVLLEWIISQTLASETKSETKTNKKKTTRGANFASAFTFRHVTAFFRLVSLSSLFLSSCHSPFLANRACILVERNGKKKLRLSSAHFPPGYCSLARFISYLIFAVVLVIH